MLPGGSTHSTPGVERSLINVDKVARIEAILRDHGMHEAFCQIRRAQKHNAMRDSRMTYPDCTCWLSKEDDNG